MKRTTIAIVLVVLLAGLAGCVGASSSQEQAQDAQTNETYTFTKPAAGVDGYWTCISWNQYDGAGNDNQMECHYVEEGE